MKEEIKYFRTKKDIRINNRILKLSKSTNRVFIVYLSRNYKNGGEGQAECIKKGRIYNPFFDVSEYKSKEYGKTLEEIIEEGFNITFAGYHGDKKDAYWNNTSWNELDLVVQSRLLSKGE